MTRTVLSLSLASLTSAAAAAPPPHETPGQPAVVVRVPPAVCRPVIGAAERGPGPVRLHRQVNVTDDGLNILGDAANEPSIAVDPTAPNRIAIGWRQFDTVQSNFRQAGRGFSRDGGRTWTMGTLDPGVFRSDPVLASGRGGELYWISLKADFRCDLFVSRDGGATWSGPAPALGGDKPWLAVDARKGGSGHLYQMYSGVLTRSIDGGLSFQPPVNVPRFLAWGTLAVGPDGEVCIAATPVGGGQPWFTRSDNAGDPSGVPTFAFTSFLANGTTSLTGQEPNPGGILGQPWVAVSHAADGRRGQVYVAATERSFGQTRTDAVFRRSVNGGMTWSAPVRLNTDALPNTAWQWFVTMSVAPNGRIDVVWNDTRENPASDRLSRLYHTSSADGGLTWTPDVPVSPAWDSHLGWPQQNKIGDYYHMVSDNVGAHLAWAATFNGEQDVYYMRLGDYDCNANGVGDAADLADGTSADCNANGIPDECELAAGTATDVNGDGRPDECQCLPDWNADGTVTSADIAAFLTSWLEGVGAGSGLGDFDASGAVNSTDISAFLTAWLAAVQGGC